MNSFQIMSNALVSVLMPVYNCELYIKEALESILTQTFSDFELIIIDDCSKDKTVSIIKGYNDPRIKLIEKAENTGLTNSLNDGLILAKGKYIARMDGDDISLSDRFEKQVNFLEKHPEVVVCGAQYRIIGTNKICNHPLTHKEIKVKLLDGSYITTVMFRSSIIRDFNISYDPQMEPAEDYDFWGRISFIGELANLPDVVLEYRVYEGQTSKKRRTEQILKGKEVKIKMLKSLITDLSANTLFVEFSNTSFKKKDMLSLFSEKMIICQSLLDSNKSKKVFDEYLFENWIHNFKRTICLDIVKQFNTNSVGLILLIFRNSIILEIMGFKKSLKLILRSII